MPSLRRHTLLPIVAVLGGCAVVPSPIDDAQMLGVTKASLDRLAHANEPIHGALSIYQAVARALKYNLDADVERLQAALRADESRLAAAQMLPSLIAQAGYSARDSTIATGKLDIPTGLELPASSTSSERAFNSGDATLGWNLVDFGLSYVRARQAADRQLIAQEARRKAIQKIIEDTRIAYWRAVSSERLSNRFHRIEERAKRAIRNTRAAVASGAETQMTALAYERELTQIMQTAEKLRHELVLAKAQLAALINVAPGLPFKLVDVIEQPDPVVGRLGLEGLFAEAVFNRPEIRELSYQQLINEQEATAALIDVLPNLGLSVSMAFSDDHFLMHGDWASVGTNVVASLVKLIQAPARRESVEAQGEVLRHKALATTAAIMTQVMIGRIRQANAAEQLETAREYREIQERLVALLRAERSTELIGEQTLIREEMNLLIAEVQHDIAIGGLQSANAAMMTALGYDILGIDVSGDTDLKSLADLVRANWSRRSAVSDHGRYLVELEKARKEAERQRQEAERRRREETKRAAEAAKQAAADAARARRLELQQAKQLASQARADAQRARRGHVKKRATALTDPPPTTWQWVWPSESAAPSDERRGSRPPNSPRSGIYSGTK